MLMSETVDDNDFVKGFAATASNMAYCLKESSGKQITKEKFP